MKPITIKQVIEDLELVEKQWRGATTAYNKGKYDGLWFALAHIKQLVKGEENENL